MFEWYHIFHQNIKQQNIFNIDNEKCFLSSKSAYYNDFWVIVTLKFLFLNNRFINVSNDECCVPKCKLKRLKPRAAQLALAVKHFRSVEVVLWLVELYRNSGRRVCRVL